MSDHPSAGKFYQALRDCFDESGERNKDFAVWFEERVEAYPIWGVHPYMEVADGK